MIFPKITRLFSDQISMGLWDYFEITLGLRDYFGITLGLWDYIGITLRLWDYFGITERLFSTMYEIFSTYLPLGYIII